MIQSDHLSSNVRIKPKQKCLVFMYYLLVGADEAASRDDEDENAEDDDRPTEEIDTLVVRL